MKDLLVINISAVNKFFHLQQWATAKGEKCDSHQLFLLVQDYWVKKLTASLLFAI